jgi:hypothetical protein
MDQLKVSKPSVVKFLAVVVAVSLLVIILLTAGGGSTKERTVRVAWAYYPAYGDSDVVELRVYMAHGDTTQLIIDGISPTDTLSRYTGLFATGQRYYFTMTAVDSSGMESEPSVPAAIKWPMTVAGVKATEEKGIEVNHN